MYHDYNSVLEAMKQSQQEKKLKKESVLENIKESNIRDNMDSLTARLMNTEDSLNRERAKTLKLQERLAEAEFKVESLPLLQAQVEVYQGDFNAEREARERIAGEKADLLDQLDKLRKQTGVRAPPPPVRPEPGFQPAEEHRFADERRVLTEDRRLPGRLEAGRLDVGRMDTGRMDTGRMDTGRMDTGRMDTGRIDELRGRMNGMADEEQRHQLPLTLPGRQQNNRAVADEERGVELNCPKCGRDFRNTTLLTRHVNDCLDRDF